MCLFLDEACSWAEKLFTDINLPPLKPNKPRTWWRHVQAKNRLRRFLCILLLFIRRWRRLFGQVMWLIGFQQLCLVHFDHRCFGVLFPQRSAVARFSCFCFLIVGIHASGISIPLSLLMFPGWILMWIPSLTLHVYQWDQDPWTLLPPKGGCVRWFLLVLKWRRSGYGQVGCLAYVLWFGLAQIFRSRRSGLNGIHRESCKPGALVKPAFGRTRCDLSVVSNLKTEREYALLL